MEIITATAERTIATPTATMTGLAAPSRGSTELSTWRVAMPPGAESPVHVVDHEQVWMPVGGSFEFTVDGVTGTVTAGQAVVVPGGTTRQFRTTGAPAEAFVAMPVAGRVGVPGSDEWNPVPWAV